MRREKEILTKAIEILVKDLDPNRIYLFGSRAKGKVGPGSDFDFAIDMESADADKARQVRDLLNAVAGLYSVDMIFLRQVDKDFRELILQTGKLIYDKARGCLLDRTV